MAGAKADGDAIEEIRIARFWQNALGDFEYVYHNPDDLRRWYKALEVRGPAEIRDHITARDGRSPTHALQGLAPAPHPPMWIVELWLDSHESRHRLFPFWIGSAGFVLLCLLVGNTMNGCTQLQDPMTWQKYPQLLTQPLQAATQGTMPTSTATLPVQPPPPPASTATSSTQPSLNQSDGASQ